MTDKPLARAMPGPLVGKKAPKGSPTFRLLGPDDKPLMTRNHQPVDGGGFTNKNTAELRATEINDYYAKNRS